MNENKKDNSKSVLIQLFTSTFMLSAFTFGGGHVITSLMQKKFVQDLKWLSEEEMLNLVAIAQSSPGPLAVNASILLGWNISGFSGALVATLGTILPPFLILTVVSFFYIAFKENAMVGAVLKSMMAGVAAVLCDVIITMVSTVIKNKKILPIIIMIGALLVIQIFRVNIIYVIIFCAVLGALVSTYEHKSGKELL